MQNKGDLKRNLDRIDGHGYPAYRDIKGGYDFDVFSMCIDHVQGDPFAAPSRVRVQVSHAVADFPENTYSNRSRRVALCDFLTRKFADAIFQIAQGRRGSGKSGRVAIDRPGQEILERTSVLVTQGGIEVRFMMGLPAKGRRVMARQAEAMFFDELPKIVDMSLPFDRQDSEALYKHIEINEDQDVLRDMLDGMGLVAFVADEATLPRASGVDERPMKGDDIVAFTSPETFRTRVKLPNQGDVEGMGIPKGITLIVGGGYHGKSTFLRALEMGVYNHIPGDGREGVVSVGDAVKIRAEDGRPVTGVDIRPFIDNLPDGRDTKAFSTLDASGSTSQAANIVEALEVGTSLLLIDEDTSATNFMIRDEQMQKLVVKDKEPITPFIDRVRQLYTNHNVSTILVVGGSGDYFAVADQVIMMDSYCPKEVTQKAKEIAREGKMKSVEEQLGEFGEIVKRIPLREGIKSRRGKRDVSIIVRNKTQIQFGEEIIDLQGLEQIAHRSQTEAIGDAIVYAKKFMDGKRTVNEVLDLVFVEVKKKGLDVLGPHIHGHYALPRKFELAAVINRLRGLMVAQ